MGLLRGVINVINGRMSHLSFARDGAPDGSGGLARQHPVDVWCYIFFVESAELLFAPMWAQKRNGRHVQIADHSPTLAVLRLCPTFPTHLIETTTKGRGRALVKRDQAHMREDGLWFSGVTALSFI